jgi:predicted transcriptional regulator
MEKNKVTAKTQIMESIALLPDDASFEDAIELILFLKKVDRGLRQAQAGETISNEEARARLAHWLQ